MNNHGHCDYSSKPKRIFRSWIQRALAGEEIIVAKGKEPVAKIVALPEAQKARSRRGASSPILP
ncbi:MAG: hypothetical protein R3B74_17945 [Nitrospirales bacterium]|nr:hypothetical protein [Nitrospirales bacterium]